MDITEQGSGHATLEPLALPDALLLDRAGKITFDPEPVREQLRRLNAFVEAYEEIEFVSKLVQLFLWNPRLESLVVMTVCSKQKSANGTFKEWDVGARATFTEDGPLGWVYFADQHVQVVNSIDLAFEEILQKAGISSNSTLSLSDGFEGTFRLDRASVLQYAGTGLPIQDLVRRLKPGLRTVVDTVRPKTAAALADTLEALNTQINGGRGSSVCRTVIDYLRMGDVERAKRVAALDMDKVRQYPDLAELFIRSGLAD